MGAVYLAEDTNLKRPVALKVLPEGVAGDPARLERFQREAEAVAALNHPNIVTIHSIEESDGIRFLTMELVEGESLDRAMPKSGFPIAKLFDLAVPMADALAAAHEKGIIHRDLKPANVMVTPEGRVKILDFGLAKLSATAAGAGGETDATKMQTREAQEEASLTGAGTVIGTIPFMSPEQLQGKKLDHRTDIFSLGVILYEMATGARPFHGENSAVLISSILRDTPPPVHERDGSLPRHLGRIVAHCLEKDPESRYQSAKDIRNELRALRREVESDPSGTTEARSAVRSAELPASPSRASGPPGWLWPAAIVASLAIVAGIVFMVLNRSGAPETAPPSTATPVPAGRRIVVFPMENLGPAEEAYFAAGIADEISSRLASIPDLTVVSRATASQYDRQGKSMERIGRDLGVDYVLDGTVRWQKGTGGESQVRVTPELIDVASDGQVWSDRFDRPMQDIFQVQSEIAGKVVEALGLRLDESQRSALAAAPTQNMEAYRLYLKGMALQQFWASDNDDTKAREQLQEAVELDPAIAAAWAGLAKARSHMHHNRKDISEENLVAAREAVDRALKLQPDLKEARAALGWYYYHGRQDYRRALEEFRRVPGAESDPEVLTAMGYVQRRLDDYDGAIESGQRALALDPGNRAAVLMLEETYSLLGRWDEDRAMVRRWRELDPNGVAPAIREALLVLNSTGDIARAREILDGLPAGARESLDSDLNVGIMASMDVRKGKYRQALDRMAQADFHLLESQEYYLTRGILEASIHWYMGDLDRAAKGYEAERARYETLAREQPDDPRYRVALASIYAGLGRKEEAIRQAELAADLHPMSRDPLGGMHWMVAKAQVLGQVGEIDAALDQLEDLVGKPGAPTRSELRQDPGWEPLRADPRFERILNQAL